MSQQYAYEAKTTSSVMADTLTVMAEDGWRPLAPPQWDGGMGVWEVWLVRDPDRRVDEC